MRFCGYEHRLVTTSKIVWDFLEAFGTIILRPRYLESYSNAVLTDFSDFSGIEYQISSNCTTNFYDDSDNATHAS